MANRYFNKQVTESRKPLAAGGPLKKSDPKGTSKSGKKPAGWTLVKPSPTTKKSRMEERMNYSKPEAVKKNRIYKKKERFTESEKAERKKKQAGDRKKHGERAPRRKTLSVTNSYKKEVEGLK
mgnify:CR=1 FL=1